MKIIGITEVGEGYHKEGAYIAIVTHRELRKVADKAGYHQEDELPKLKVGDDHDLGAGHDFRGELKDSIRKMQEAYLQFAKVAPIAAKFAGLVLEHDDHTGESDK